jgi:hypothetical protein
MIKEFWDRLDKKQRYYVAGAAAFVVIVLILEFGIFPFGEAKENIRQSISANQKRLNEMIKLDEEFVQQEAKIAWIKRAMAARPADFSLFAYLERKAAQAGVRGNIKNMNSARGTQTANYEESFVDIRLDKITIKQLTDFLYYAESPTDQVKIRKIAVNKMKESPEYLSAQVQVASLQTLNLSPAGKH